MAGYTKHAGMPAVMKPGHQGFPWRAEPGCPVPAGAGPQEQPEKKEGWAQRVLAKPRTWLALGPSACGGSVTTAC